MAVVTLTTDWKNNDYYVGSVKGKILSYDQSINIIDITHQVQPFNSMQAAFILRNCFQEFPKGTIHIVGVNAALSRKVPLLIIEKEQHFFLSSDTGFPDLLFPDEKPKVYKYDLTGTDGDNFASLNTFISVMKRLLEKEKPDKIGTLTTDYVSRIPFVPTFENNLINGSVIYIDSFCNAITNINKELFERVGKGQPFEIFVQSNHYRLKKINDTYAQSEPGELLAIFNSVGLLEIAINSGRASELLNLDLNSAIRIKFHESRSDKQELKLSGD